MKIETVLEQVYLQEWNTTALILESRIVVMFFNNIYMDRQDCFNYINEHCKGWIQTSSSFRIYKGTGEKTGIEYDPILPYEKLYDDLLSYAKNKFGDNFNHA